MTSWASKCFKLKCFSLLLCRHASGLCTQGWSHRVPSSWYLYISEQLNLHLARYSLIDPFSLSQATGFMNPSVSRRKHGWAFSYCLCLESATGVLDLNPRIPAVLQGTSRLDWHKGMTSPWKGVYWCMWVNAGNFYLHAKSDTSHPFQEGCSCANITPHFGANKLQSGDGHICLLHCHIYSAAKLELSHLMDSLYRSWNTERVEDYSMSSSSISCSFFREWIDNMWVWGLGMVSSFISYISLKIDKAFLKKKKWVCLTLKFTWMPPVSGFLAAELTSHCVDKSWYF